MSLTNCSFPYHELCECFHWVLGFPDPYGTEPKNHPFFVPGLLTNGTSETPAACSIISQIEADVAEAKDALLGAKILQAFFANKSCGREDTDHVCNQVILPTIHRCHEYKASNQTRVVKNFPCWDGPFSVTRAFPETSSYSLHLPNSPNVFPMYHTTLLKHFNENNASLFPSHEPAQLGPVITENDLEEYHIEKIIDKQRRGHEYQYLVQ